MIDSWKLSAHISYLAVNQTQNNTLKYYRVIAIVKRLWTAVAVVGYLRSDLQFWNTTKLFEWGLFIPVPISSFHFNLNPISISIIGFVKLRRIDDFIGFSITEHQILLCPVGSFSFIFWRRSLILS